ncbi:MAG TPA: tetratricopeptide repeat protein, partial [Tepidisphaeraceae bacterium]
MITRSNLFLASLILIAAAGCNSDMITYSRDAQREGEKLYQKGDYADAAGAFRNSVRQNPRSYEGYYWLGMSYTQIGQYQQAIASFKTARQTIDLTPEGKLDDDMRSKIISGLANAIAKSDERDVETNVATNDAKNFGGAESWFLLAKIYAYRGDADSAIDAYNRAALLDPTSFYISKDYGLYMERIGQKQRAEAPLRRAYSLNCDDAEVAAALRRIGIIPGPGLLNEDQLARPIIPKGPIPEVHMPGGNSTASGS